MSADAVYSKSMRQATAALCKNAGFDSVDQDTLGLLVEMITSYTVELAHSSKQLAEGAGRTAPNPGDVILALIEMGGNVSQLPDYLKNSAAGSIVIPAPKPQTATSTVDALRIGKAKPHAAHIPDFLPPFPDPHTYIKTDVSGDPDSSYQKVRELAAAQRRNVDNALKNLMLSTSKSVPLFREYEESVRQAAKAEIARERGQQKTVDPTDLALIETENAKVRRKVPAYCQLLDPTTESRPYLSALISEDFEEEHSPDQEQFAIDNVYLRSPKIPAQPMEFD
uniref:Transcription initiation factor TFIID subunit 8 n=1 Tax=Plectus sambesii TaxID=2011161 RepID=A0A914US32_9BILA